MDTLSVHSIVLVQHYYLCYINLIFALEGNVFVVFALFQLVANKGLTFKKYRENTQTSQEKNIVYIYIDYFELRSRESLYDYEDSIMKLLAGFM